jgi:hypothetical protein
VRGPRRPAIPDALAFAAGLVWLVVAARDEADFLGVWLPWGLVGGAGIGLGLPTLIGASAAGLPPTRFATGMALATTARQLAALLVGRRPQAAAVAGATPEPAIAPAAESARAA